MPEAAAVTPAEIRAYANLPPEVPEALLTKHLGIAERDLVRTTGVAAAPEGLDQEWAEALTLCALASVFPWLNTFALSGAAKVGRLEGSVEYRFLTPEEVEEQVNTLTARFEELVAIITPAEDDETAKDHASVGAVSLMSI
ncbi:MULTISPECIES: hypothetical protein [unclassified Phaeobacter]|uniref:hypothetical protein n=1 Tax=unclassified Phaeobacter TaxID=2621772 RepID=UPI003A8AFCDB